MVGGVGFRLEEVVCWFVAVAMNPPVYILLRATLTEISVHLLWILTHCRLVASIDLHPDTFQPRNGTQTSVLILQRKTEAETIKELRQQRFDDYEIFMAQALAVGHDKRGNALYKRDEQGEEILFPQEGEENLHLDFDAYSQPSVRILRPSRRLDDDSPVISSEFLSWKKQAVLGW